MAMHIADNTPGSLSGFAWNKAGHLPAFSIPLDLPAQVHQPAALPKNGDIPLMRFLDRALEALVFGQLASINLGIPAAYVDPVDLWQRSVMHRAEWDYPSSSQLHQLQVVAVIEVEGLVLSDAYGEILAGIVFQIKVWFYLGQGLGFASYLPDSIQIQAFLHDLPDPVHPLLEALVAGLPLQHRHQAQMAHGQVHILIAPDSAHHLHLCIAFDLPYRFVRMPCRTHLIQYHPSELNGRIVVHIPLDQGSTAAGDAARVHHEDDRHSEHLGNLSGRAEISLISLVKATHPLDHRHIRPLRSMCIDLADGSFVHQIAIQVAAASACDPGMIAGIYVVHGHLEGLNLQIPAPQGGEQARYYGRLAAGASVPR